MEKKQNAFLDKQRRQLEAKMQMDEVRRKEQEERRRELQRKEEERKNRKMKAELDEASRKANKLDRFQQQEENLRKILDERDASRRQKVLQLQLRNDQVQEAVQRHRRKLQYNKEATLQRVKEKNDKVEFIKSHRENFVTQSRNITQSDAHTRQLISDWLETIHVTGSHEVPAWLNIDLTSYRPIFEKCLEKQPKHIVEQVMNILNQNTNYKPHAVPMIQTPSKQYYSKWMYSED